MSKSPDSAESQPSASHQMAVSEDLSMDHLTNDDVGSSFSSSGSPPPSAPTVSSPFSARKKRLMHSRLSEQMSKEQMTDDESRDESGELARSPWSAARAKANAKANAAALFAAAGSGTPQIAAKRRLTDRMDKARLSSSSDSSVKSLPTPSKSRGVFLLFCKQILR